MMKSKQTSLPISKYGNIGNWYDLTDNRPISKELYNKLKDDPNCSHDVTKFDSILELEVYKILRVKFASNEIIHHFALEILSKDDSNKAIRWNVDFKVSPKDCLPFYVEAKGFETDDYCLRRTLLKRFHPAINDRVMVAAQKNLQKFAHKIAVFELWKDDVEINKY